MGSTYRTYFFFVSELSPSERECCIFLNEGMRHTRVFIFMMSVFSMHVSTFPVSDWRVGFCAWCPFAKVEDKIVRQSDEQSRECVYEAAIDACMNGRVECLADKDGKRSCIRFHKVNN